MTYWEDILAPHTPRWDADKLTGFDSNTNSSGAKLIPLTQYRFIQIQGIDAEKFIQGQCTCDFRSLKNGIFAMGAHCTHQGRMISSFVSAKGGDDSILLRIHTSIADDALNALQKYIVFSKAEISLSDELLGIGLINPPVKIVEEIGANNIEIGSYNNTSSGEVILRHNEARIEIWLKRDKISEQLTQWSSISALAPPSEWDTQLIQEGIPEIRSGTQETYIPQMLNFHLIDGVSFKKGCYTGQEIIARMKYKGQAKKHLYGATAASSPTPALAGEPLISAESEKVVGHVVMHSTQANTDYLLAVVSDEFKHSGIDCLLQNSGSKISWAELPYAIN